MLQEQSHAGPRNLLVGEKVGCVVHAASPSESRATAESRHSRQGQIVVNLTSEPWSANSNRVDLFYPRE